MGWLCDFATYWSLLQFFGSSPFAANFVSSYVGVSFVYFTSLHYVFDRDPQHKSLYLGLYWGWQFLSILAYSTLLTLLVGYLLAQDHVSALADYAGVSGKIIITPVNLVTNFLFMKFLTRFMRERIE